MLRRLLITLAALTVLFGAVGIWFWQRFLTTELTRIDDHFYVLSGGGGNSAILIGDDGVLVVDTKQFRPATTLAKTIRELTDKPVRLIINTHYHQDHTHGNPQYAVGTTVMAQRRTRQHLIDLDKGFWLSDPTSWDLMPSDLVDDSREFPFGDETVRVMHLGRGHTDGDVVVQFVKRGVLHTGDLFVNHQYPYLDRKGGGSARAWVETLDRVLAIQGIRQYIPGHGAIAAAEDVRHFQQYWRDVLAHVTAGVQSGASLKDIQRSEKLSAYDDFHAVPFFTTRANNIKWVYEELTSK